MTKSKNRIQSIEVLANRYDQLKSEKIAAETRCDEAQTQLESLQQEAEKLFGTSDIAELKKKLSQMESENEKLQREYQQHLDQIESDLSKVETGFEQHTNS